MSEKQDNLSRFYREYDDFDPSEWDSTNLDEVPGDESRALIAWNYGGERETSLTFIIKRAMADPNAEVIPL